MSNLKIECVTVCEEDGYEQRWFDCPNCKKEARDHDTALYMEDIGYLFNVECDHCKASFNLKKITKSIDGECLCEILEGK